MSLLVNGDSIRVVQMGWDFVIVETPFDLAPCAGTLALQVDKNERTWDVLLPEGLSAGSNRVAIA